MSAHPAPPIPAHGQRCGQVLSPFAFLDCFGVGRRLAIVGNAPSAGGAGQGAAIDACDTVVRFNGCRTSGFEADIGSRTDLLCVHHRIGRVAARDVDGGIDAAATTPLLVMNNSFAPDVDEDEFWSAAGGRNVFFTFAPSLAGLPDPAHTAGLSTGTQCIHFLGRFLRPREVFLTGFTLYLDEAASDHYWEDSHVAHTARMQQNHDYGREREIFCQVVNHLWCPLTATADIARIFDAAGVAPAKGIRFTQG